MIWGQKYTKIQNEIITDVKDIITDSVKAGLTVVSMFLVINGLVLVTSHVCNTFYLAQKLLTLKLTS